MADAAYENVGKLEEKRDKYRNRVATVDAVGREDTAVFGLGKKPLGTSCLRWYRSKWTMEIHAVDCSLILFICARGTTDRILTIGL